MTLTPSTTRDRRAPEAWITSRGALRVRQGAAEAAGYPLPVVYSVATHEHVIDPLGMDIGDPDGRLWEVLMAARRAARAATADDGVHRFIVRIPYVTANAQQSGMGSCALALTIAIRRVHDFGFRCFYVDTPTGVRQ